MYVANSSPISKVAQKWLPSSPRPPKRHPSGLLFGESTVHVAENRIEVVSKLRKWHLSAPQVPNVCIKLKQINKCVVEVAQSCIQVSLNARKWAKATSMSIQSRTNTSNFIMGRRMVVGNMVKPLTRYQYT